MRSRILRLWRFILFGTTCSGKHTVGGGHIASLLPFFLTVAALITTLIVIVALHLRGCLMYSGTTP